MTVDGIGLLCACVNNLAGCVLMKTPLSHRQHRSICITCALSLSPTQARGAAQGVHHDALQRGAG
jgi:hypothetical protein